MFKRVFYAANDRRAVGGHDFMKSYKRMRSIFLIGLLALGAALFVYVAALEQTAPENEHARLASQLPRVPVALNQGAVDELQFALQHHDQTLIETMIGKGKALSVAQNRRVTVLARYKKAVVVEILEGAQTGKTVWVLPSFLAPDLPETSLPDQTPYN